MIYIIFIFGILIGSFLNTCIYGLPKRQSFTYLLFHCSSCGIEVKNHHIVSIINYIFLKGRCSHCNQRISWRYPLVEFLNGIIYVLMFINYGFSILFLNYAIISSILIVISFIDYDYQIIPDKILLFGFLTNMTLITLYNSLDYLFNGVLGLLLGGGILFVIAILTKGAMGGGDIKLMAMLGMTFGPKYTLITLLMSFIIGAIISVMLLATGKKERKDFIPFGPFISIAAVVTVLYGDEIFNMYIDFIL